MEAFAILKQPRFFNGDSLENSEAKPAGKSHTMGCLKSPVIAVNLSDQTPETRQHLLLWRTHIFLDLPEFNRDTTIIFNWECSICPMFYMPNVPYAQCYICPIFYMPNVLYAQCSICPMFYTPNVLYAQCSLCPSIEQHSKFLRDDKKLT